MESQQNKQMIYEQQKKIEDQDQKIRELGKQDEAKTEKINAFESDLKTISASIHKVEEKYEESIEELTEMFKQIKPTVEKLQTELKKIYQ